MPGSRARSLVAEGLGTAFLLVAVTVSDTFVGTRPADGPGFVAAQVLGAASGTVVDWLGRADR